MASDRKFYYNYVEYKGSGVAVCLILTILGLALGLITDVPTRLDPGHSIHKPMVDCIM